MYFYGNNTKIYIAHLKSYIAYKKKIQLKLIFKKKKLKQNAQKKSIKVLQICIKKKKFTKKNS